MMQLTLTIDLLSDATFGRGDGMAGLVDEEVEHNPETGLPFIRGSVIKGLLAEECANILFALSKCSPAAPSKFQNAAQFLFGQPGSTIKDDACMQVGSATLPQELNDAIAADLKWMAADENRKRKYTISDVLESLTAIRRQTAVNDDTGIPDEGSLRSIRVVLRKTQFKAVLSFTSKPDKDAKALLAACVMAMRRGGDGRNRGRGRLQAWLKDKVYTEKLFDDFQQLIQRCAS